jgi:predicted Mrr-cat superfamily restriction endonuclease
MERSIGHARVNKLAVVYREKPRGEKPGAFRKFAAFVWRFENTCHLAKNAEKYWQYLPF